MNEPMSQTTKPSAEYTAATLTVLRNSTDAIARARALVRAHEEERRAVIWDAIYDGVSVAAVADATGLSRERVYQIRHGRR